MVESLSPILTRRAEHPASLPTRPGCLHQLQCRHLISRIQQSHLSNSQRLLDLWPGRPPDQTGYPLRISMCRPLSIACHVPLMRHLSTLCWPRHPTPVSKPLPSHRPFDMQGIVVPSSALGLHLHDREFRFCLQYWLGLRMFEDNRRCPVCQADADPLGDHQVGCGGNSDRILRHNSLRDAVFSAAQSAALAPRREAPSLVPGSQSRPADIYLPCWKRGRPPAAVDVTVISTMQQSTIQGAAENQGHARRIAEERKFAAHVAACQAAGISFIPLAVETLGGLSVTAADTISSIGRLMGQRFGISPSESTRHLFQRLSISLWRGNATIWIHCSPSSVDRVV